MRRPTSAGTDANRTLSSFAAQDYEVHSNRAQAKEIRVLDSKSQPTDNNHCFWARASAETL